MRQVAGRPLVGRISCRAMFTLLQRGWAYASSLPVERDTIPSLFAGTDRWCGSNPATRRKREIAEEQCLTALEIMT